MCSSRRVIIPASNNSIRESYKCVYILCLTTVIEMFRKIFAIVGALIAGGLGIAVVAASQAAAITHGSILPNLHGQLATGAGGAALATN